MSTTQHVVCPHCHAVNRISPSRMADGPRCGKCHNALFDGHPVALAGSNFQKHIGRNDIPVVVDFWADWCGPCKMMAPAFQEAAARLEPTARLAKVDTEAEHAIAAQFQLRSIPTTILFKNGREISRQSGAMGAADIVRWVQTNC